MKYQIDDCIGSKLRKLSRIVDNEYRKNLASFNITESQLSMLMILSKLKSIEQGKIGNYLSLERSTISRNVKKLVKNGWVKRSEAYQPKICLTSAGESLLKEVLPSWEKTMDNIKSRIGQRGIQYLTDLEIALQ